MRPREGCTLRQSEIPALWNHQYPFSHRIIHVYFQQHPSLRKTSKRVKETLTHFDALLRKSSKCKSLILFISFSLSYSLYLLTFTLLRGYPSRVRKWDFCGWPSGSHGGRKNRPGKTCLRRSLNRLYRSKNECNPGVRCQGWSIVDFRFSIERGTYGKGSGWGRSGEGGAKVPGGMDVPLGAFEGA